MWRDLRKIDARQATFDTVLNALRRQGVPSVDDDYACLFVNEDGARCAIGHLMTDEQLLKYGIKDGMGIKADEFTLFFQEHTHLDRQLFNCLQTAHDHASSDGDFVASFEYRMAAIADNFGLVYDYEQPGEESQ